jgi:selenium-binding protein 1
MAPPQTDPSTPAAQTLAAQVQRERLAQVTLVAPRESARTDAVGIVDLDPFSPAYGRLVGKDPAPDDMGRELHPARERARHAGHDTVISVEGGTAGQQVGELDLEVLARGDYGHALRVSQQSTGRPLHRALLGDGRQLVLALQAAHNPLSCFGFAAVVVSAGDLSSSIWLWHRDEERADGGGWAARRIIDIPAQPAAAARLPAVLQDIGAVPPLATNLGLSGDDRFLYVSCWGAGELRRYDVWDPFAPRLTGVIRLGGIVERAAHPGAPAKSLGGGPHRIAISGDDRRLYVTSSLCGPWDEQFYPDRAANWLAKIDVDEEGEMTVDRNFRPDFGGLRACQVQLDSALALA